MPRRRNKNWSQAVGLWGRSLRVTERKPNGPLYLTWVTKEDGKRRFHWKSLGHRNKKAAVQEAMALAATFSKEGHSSQSRTMTLGQLFELYFERGVFGKREEYVAEQKRKLQRWIHAFGPD